MIIPERPSLGGLSSGLGGGLGGGLKMMAPPVMREDDDDMQEVFPPRKEERKGSTMFNEDAYIERLKEEQSYNTCVSCSRPF